jgi:hypothetical protein
VLLAIRSMRLLCVLLFLAAAFMAWRTFGSGVRRYSAGLIFRNIGIYAIPAVGYLICIFGLLERRMWTVVFALVLASLHLLGNCLLLGVFILRASRGGATIESGFTVPIVITGLWVIAIAQLVWHLVLSVRGIRYDMAGHADEDAAGFEVLPPR